MIRSAARDDARYAEDAMVAFAMYCDTHGLTGEQREELADRVYDALSVSIDTSQFLPEQEAS